MKSYRRRFALLLLLSLSLHIFLLWWLLANLEASQETQDDSKSVKITLKSSIKPEEPLIIPVVPEELPEVSEAEPEPEPEPEPEKAPPEPEKQDPEPEPEEIPEPEEAPETAPAPVDNADEFASDNQEDESITKIDFGADPKTEKTDDNKLSDQVESPELAEEPIKTRQIQEIQEPPKQEQTAPEIAEKPQPPVKEVLVTESAQSNRTVDPDIQEQKAPAETETPVNEALSGKPEPDQLDELSGKVFTTGDDPILQMELTEDFAGTVGNLYMLSEEELQEAEVKQPFSETESKELKLVNEYLERMNQQVMAYWINPYKGNKMLRGVVRLELNSKGYIEDVYVYMSSGSSLLDISVLDAIRAVPRFEVPENEIIADRYYRNLRFHYSSKETKTELMPFEKQQETE